ncbi:transposase [Emticicia agri]|uniref:IS110 family transposase n=3 Tax=Emticicia agri TaxID=2492393 RepID=A0A4V1ZC82_9BACT|nr:transposase [Emticicia agri]RYU91750.1 IS110 family transposase [Emticicia agri]RYU92852.1 IS110 family transposase [Emticicia agri]RYU93536.1 IS110 family transposase [Emticicia agri]RYU93659.1 IS110 family transposase [Emticicia agri]RYU94856.1 IS110 family transposase [Emticicia agri]
MTINKQYIGIDVGSHELVIAQGLSQASSKFIKLPVQTIDNTIEAINQWIETLGENVHIIFEQTGTYNLPLSYALTLHEITFSVITPSQSKGFVKSMKVTHQHDGVDAALLSLYGANYQPAPTSIEDEHLHHLRQKRKHLSTLMTQKQAYENQLHALSFDPRADKLVIESLELLQMTLQIQITKFKEELFTLDDDQHKHLFGLIKSVVGIGDASANALIIASDGFKNFSNVKQVLKFLGIVPIEKHSSKSVHKNYGLAKTGLGYVRAILYMAARSAKKYNLACVAVYQRQRALGKAHKVAMIAVMNKLIRQVFGVVKNQTLFVNDFEFAK